MFGKILELVLSAKSSAVSGVLILAGGAVVSASGAGMTTLALHGPEATPIVEVAEPDASPLDELLDEPEGDDLADDLKLIPVDDADCEGEGTAREQARQRIEAAFAKYDAGFDTLRAQLGGKGSAQTYAAIDSADALLTEILQQAISALEDMGLCDAQELALAEGAVAFAFRGGAAAMHEVADRAVEAMEVVYELARSTVLAELERLKPTPTPKPKPTPKPTPDKGNDSNDKWVRCDDHVYAAKMRLQKAFDQFHGGNDKLIWEIQKWADERTVQALKRADEVLHRTYDTTREAIARAGCATGANSGIALAERASAILEETYAGSRGIAQAAMAYKPDRDRCQKQMYTAKQVLYTNYERLHGANDRLWKVMDGFSETTRSAIQTADRIIHETYDRAKEGIYKSACGPNGSNAMELAANAVAISEAAHSEARRAVADELTQDDD